MHSEQQTAMKRRQRQKGIALQIALQLPDDPAEALAVLADAKWLVENFLTYVESHKRAEAQTRLSVVPT